MEMHEVCMTSKLQSLVDYYQEQIKQLGMNSTYTIPTGDLSVFLSLSSLRIEDNYPVLVVDAESFIIKMRVENETVVVETHMPNRKKSEDLEASTIEVLGLSLSYALQHPDFWKVIYKLSDQVVTKGVGDNG
jgi:hypothetical protein